jgi:hypothetical protein
VKVRVETVTTEVLDLTPSDSKVVKQSLLCSACGGAGIMMGQSSGIERLLHDKLQQPDVVVVVVVVVVMWYHLIHQLKFIVRDTQLI